jgi:hypothetical protein
MAVVAVVLSVDALSLALDCWVAQPASAAALVRRTVARTIDAT